MSLTALKRNKETNQLVTRFYNFTNQSVPLSSLTIPGYEAKQANLLEEITETTRKNTVDPFEIVTQLWEKHK